MNPEAKPIRVAVLTVSDSAFRGEREDLSGPAAEAEIMRLGFRSVGVQLLPDEPEKIREKLIEITDELQPDILLTTGGTGLGPRDHTPEATASIIEKEVPGLGELMRAEGAKKTPRAHLSRGLVGVRKGKLIVNLPGSVRGASESLEAILKILPHAVDIAQGRTAHE